MPIAIQAKCNDPVFDLAFVDDDLDEHNIGRAHSQEVQVNVNVGSTGPRVLYVSTYPAFNIGFARVSIPDGYRLIDGWIEVDPHRIYTDKTQNPGPVKPAPNAIKGACKFAFSLQDNNSGVFSIESITPYLTGTMFVRYFLKYSRMNSEVKLYSRADA
jgi:hypothetical protein